MSTYEVHGGVTDEMLDQFFADNPEFRPLQSTAPTEPSPEPAPEPEPAQPTPQSSPPEEGEPPEPSAPAQPEEPAETPEPEPEPAPEEVPEVSPEDFLDIAGQRYARSQIEAAARFQQQLAADSDLQNLIRNYLAGTEAIASGSVGGTPAGDGSAPAGVPAAQLPTTQPEIDLDDPSIAALYRLVQSQSEQIQQLTYGLQVSNQSQIARQRQEAQGLWEKASESFAKDHNLNSDDIDHLSSVAARLGVLPQLMSGIDPITNTPVTPDPLKAFDRALEIAMLSVPEYRDKEFRRSVQKQQEESRKKKLLGAVGGSSGSVARTTAPPKPGSPEAKRAMLAEVGSMMNGEWHDPNAN